MTISICKKCSTLPNNTLTFGDDDHDAVLIRPGTLATHRYHLSYSESIIVFGNASADGDPPKKRSVLQLALLGLQGSSSTLLQKLGRFEGVEILKYMITRVSPFLRLPLSISYRNLQLEWPSLVPTWQTKL